MARYISTKLFENYSVALRQWRASHSHCELLHGYALKFKVWFASNEPDIDKQLDDMNWIVDYGGFKTPPKGNGLKDWMNHMWDHTLLIEKDDPYLDKFKQMDEDGVIQLRILPATGCEKFAEHLYYVINAFLKEETEGRVKAIKVEVYEHERNSASYEE